MTLQLYDFPLSGNCYKVRLLLSFLGLSYATIPINVKLKETKQPDFLHLNPFGQVPVLVDGNFVLRDSLAIMVYLVRQYARSEQSFWLPDQPRVMAEILSWAMVGNNEIQQTIAQLRRHYFLGEAVHKEELEAKAHVVLGILERHLAEGKWLVGNQPTIADIVCFAYVGLAGDARLSLESYPHIRRWLRDFQALDGYISMAGMPTY